MILTQISLKNIRSFNDDSEVTIDLPAGTVLFEGDVGAGKSSILYGVEFALFGLGDLAGDGLLSDGKASGHVRVRFSHAGKEYDIHRGLRRKGEAVAQEACFITENGRRIELSPGDLKQRIVGLLGFNEPSHPRAESLVFRFAVFTPQEQMKDIVTRKPEERLPVLRRVLGIQSYSVAADNSETLQNRISGEARSIDLATRDLERLEDEAKQEKSRLDSLDTAIPELRRKEEAAKAEVDVLSKSVDRAREEQERVASFAGRVPELRRSISRLNKEVEEISRSNGALARRIKEDYIPSITRFEANPQSRTGKPEGLESEVKTTRALLGKKQITLGLLQERLRETNELIAQGVCPRCHQEISDDFDEQSAHISGELSSIKSECADIEGRLGGLEGSLEAWRLFEKEKVSYDRDVKDKAEAEGMIADAEIRKKEAESELSRLKDDLAAASTEEAKLKEIGRRLEAASSAMRIAEPKRELASKELTEALTKKEEGAKSLERLQSSVSEMRALRTKSQRLKVHSSWLSTYFRPTVQVIEKQMMVQANASFNLHFRRFFAALVDDPDLQVRVTEDFSPVSERQGYVQDYSTLSGGERTSVALAYRLALSSVVMNEVGQGAGDLVILDEPTDGFSREQVQKMREVIDELHSRQVILVSHERELESMADRIIRVEKANGTSRIS